MADLGQCEECNRYASVRSLCTDCDDSKEIERLEKIEAAAKVYFADYDLHMGVPCVRLHKELRDALAASEGEG